MKPQTEAWIEVAEIDHRLANRAATPPDPIPEGVCFHAQQCIEKYLKAVLEEAGRPIPRTHDLDTLLLAASDLIPQLAPYDADLRTISPYAVALRYPGGASPYDDLTDDATLAQATMTATRAIIRSTLGL